MWVLFACLGLLVAVNASVVVYTQDLPHTIAEEFRDLPASFGDDLPANGLRGFLKLAAPLDGCSPLEPAPKNETNFTGKWIVLIARYNCNFEKKVREAQAAGYDCAIVHNVNSSDLETMSAKDSDGITIPSVFVSDLAGLMLANEYTYKDGYYIMVNGDIPFNISTHLLLPFAIVVALCLIVMLIFMIVKCIKDRRRARRHRLPRRALRKIPTCKFSKGDPYDTCAICLDDYRDGDRLRVLPCAHAYHVKCIDPWLTQGRRVCPVCKRRVLAAGERRASASSDDSDDSRAPLLPPPAPALAAPSAARRARSSHSSHSSDGSGPGRSADTQGGTFEEQRENPFVRAARFMRRLRARTADGDGAADAQEAPAVEANDQTNNEEEEIAQDERRPLVEPALRAVSERGARRPRPRRRRSEGAPHVRPSPPAHPSPPAATPSDDHHSINTERGEIGVAAIPAPQLAPDHVRL